MGQVPVYSGDGAAERGTGGGVGGCEQKEMSRGGVWGVLVNGAMFFFWDGLLL